jgi:hypothetical protein
MSADVSYFFLFGGIHLDVFLFSMLTYDKSIVNLGSGSNEEWPKFLDLLENVGSRNSLTHTDDGPFIVAAKRSLIGLVLVKLRLDECSSLSFIDQFSPQTEEGSC